MSSFRLFRVLHLRHLRRQPVRAVLGLLSVGAGVSVSVAAMLLLSSLDHSTEELLRALAGPAPLRVVGPMMTAGLDEKVADRVAGIRGVDAVVPTVQAVAFAEAKDGRELSIVAFGVDCRVEVLVGAFGCDEQTLRSTRADAPVLISSSLARDLGDGAVVRTNAGRVALDGVAVNDGLDGTNRGRIAVFALPTAQRLFSREGLLDALYVQPADGVAVGELQKQIKGVVGNWNHVLRKVEFGPAESVNGPIMPLLGLTVAIALGFSGLLVYNIVSLSLAERRRDLAVAGAVGASASTITRGILAEAVLLGLAGGALGALMGIGFASFIVGQASEIFLTLSMELHLSPYVLATGVALGALTSLVAAYVPARRTRRLDLAAELHGRAVLAEETPRRTRMRLMVFLTVGGAAIILSRLAERNGSLDRWQPPAALLALLVGGVALLAAVGAVAPLLLGFAQRALRSTGGTIRVAVANLVANPRRTSVVATAAGASVGLACVLAAMGPATQVAVRDTAGKAADGRVWVSTLQANNSGTVDGRPSPEVRQALAALPGVARVDEGPCVFALDDAGAVSVCAHEGSRVMFDAVVGDVSPEALDRGEAILGPGAARSRGLRPGSVFRLPTPHGFEDVRVAGIWKKLHMNGYSVTVSPDRFDEVYGSRPSEAVLLRPAPGVTEEELVRRVMAAKLDPDLYARTSQEYSSQLADEISDQAEPFWTLQRVLLFVALIATLSTLLLVGVQRTRELGVLGAVGFGPAGLARITIAEAVTAALMGSLLGIVASLGLYEVFRNAGAAAVGHLYPFTFAVATAAVSVVLALIVVTLGALLPAWRTSRLQIVEAIRDE